jgi:hypothetical protein
VEHLPGVISFFHLSNDVGYRRESHSLNNEPASGLSLLLRIPGGV